MTFWHFLFVLFVLGDVKCTFGFDGPSGSVVIQRNGSAEDYGRSLGYFVKIDGREENRGRGWRQNFAFLKTEKSDYSGNKYVSEDPLDRGIIVVFKPTDDGQIRDGEEANSSYVRPENKSDPVAPLHVTNTARKECIEGFKADENGICQKFLIPKGDKSFKLRRKKRAEQSGQKLSYADVVKYGRNPPKNTAKPEVFATVLPSEKEKFPATTLRIHSQNRYKTTTPTPKEKELPQMLSPTIRLPVFTTLRTPPATMKVPSATIKAPSATIKALSATVKAPPTTIKAPSATVKVPPTTIKAPSATIKAPSATVKVLPTTIKAPPTTIKALPTTVYAPLATTTKTITLQKTVKSPGSLSSSVDINEAFLAVEKSSAVAQHQDGKMYIPLTPMTIEKKTFDSTRLRRRALV